MRVASKVVQGVPDPPPYAQRARLFNGSRTPQGDAGLDPDIKYFPQTRSELLSSAVAFLRPVLICTLGFLFLSDALRCFSSSFLPSLLPQPPPSAPHHSTPHHTTPLHTTPQHATPLHNTSHHPTPHHHHQHHLTTPQHLQPTPKSNSTTVLHF